MAELEKIIPEFVGGEEVLTKGPQSSANDDDNDDDASQSSIEIGETEDDFLEYLERPKGVVVEAITGNLANIDAAASEPSE